jgi:hypothetical protein
VFLNATKSFEIGYGGMIVCATNINAAGYTGPFRHIKNWAASLLGRWSREQRTNFIIQQKREDVNTRLNEAWPDARKLDPSAPAPNLMGLTGWSIGNLFHGHYISHDGVLFNEKSFTVDIRGVSIDFVMDVAQAMRNKFKQESVLVVDHKTGVSHIVED